MQAFGLLILRVGLGFFMIVHGWGKATKVFNGEFDKFLDPIGMEKPPV